MKIFSNSIVDGYLSDKCGHRGNQFNGSKPNYSFHIGWSDLPKDTKSLALFFVDHDAIPVCGFSWIHWVVANIDPTLGQLLENDSVDMDLLEGVTSWNSPLLPDGRRLEKKDAIGYGGCAPPDKEHSYTINVYALSRILNLEDGFYANELFKAMDGFILDKARLVAKYKIQSSS